MTGHASEMVLCRIHAALDALGVPEHGGKTRTGRYRLVATKTGYSDGRISDLLNGKGGISVRFITVFCNAFGVRRDFVLYGMGPILVGVVSAAPDSLPWSRLFAAGWRIVGLNHYRLRGVTYLFCAMTKDDRCIVAEHACDAEVFAELEKKAGLGGGP
jgi:hypothetical protein